MNTKEDLFRQTEAVTPTSAMEGRSLAGAGILVKTLDQ